MVLSLHKHSIGYTGDGITDAHDTE